LLVILQITYLNIITNLCTFVARGPNFKKSKVIKSFRNVDVYPLLCELTQITCNPHNGSLDTFNDSLIFETKKNQAHDEQLLKKQKTLKNRNKVLVFLFDGMQSAKFEEFLRDNPNSTFNQLINDGVKAEYMIPSFSTLTFSNHYTLATGCYFFKENFI
jgi:hypothetical protein